MDKFVQKEMENFTIFFQVLRIELESCEGFLKAVLSRGIVLLQDKTQKNGSARGIVLNCFIAFLSPVFCVASYGCIYHFS
jgi:hypothetical protein